MKKAPDSSSNRDSIIKESLGLAVLALMVSQCPGTPLPAPIHHPSSETSNTTRTTLKRLLETLTSERNPEDDPNEAYLPDPETRDQYVDAAVNCLEDSGEFVCARDRSYYQTYQCLPLDDYGEAPSVPLQVKQSSKLPEWCAEIDFFDRPWECENYLAPQMALWNGLKHGEVDFDRSRFEIGKDSFCEQILDWSHSNSITEDTIEAHCEGLFGQTEYITDCYNFSSAWNNFGLHSLSVQNMSDEFFDQLDENSFEFEQNSNGHFTVWIDGIEFPVSLISTRPTTFDLENENPFSFEIGLNEIYLQNYSGDDASEMTTLLKNIRTEMEEAQPQN